MTDKLQPVSRFRDAQRVALLTRDRQSLFEKAIVGEQS